MLRQAYGRDHTFIVLFFEKNVTYMWACTVQTHFVQGSAVHISGVFATICKVGGIQTNKEAAGQEILSFMPFLLHQWEPSGDSVLIQGVMHRQFPLLAVGGMLQVCSRFTLHTLSSMLFKRRFTTSGDSSHPET